MKKHVHSLINPEFNMFVDAHQAIKIRMLVLCCNQIFALLPFSCQNCFDYRTVQSKTEFQCETTWPHPTDFSSFMLSLTSCLIAPYRVSFGCVQIALLYFRSSAASQHTVTSFWM